MYFLHSSVKKKSSYGCCMESEKQQGLKYCIAFYAGYNSWQNLMRKREVSLIRTQKHSDEYNNNNNSNNNNNNL